MPSVIRHTEQRGKGRLQNGQAVASIRRKHQNFWLTLKLVDVTLFAVAPPCGSLITLLQ